MLLTTRQRSLSFCPAQISMAGNHKRKQWPVSMPPRVLHQVSESVERMTDV